MAYDQLRRKGKLVVTDNPQLQHKLLLLFHDSPVGRHSKVTTTFRKLTSLVYQKGLWNVVSNYMRGCFICQKYKNENVASPGLLQPLPIPLRVFTNITMDFIEDFPKSKGKSVIFILVDRLTKYSHFMALDIHFRCRFWLNCSRKMSLSFTETRRALRVTEGRFSLVGFGVIFLSYKALICTI